MSLGRSIATGALWMVALNVFVSAIGIVSTVILARLLMPSDFGLIAMAMSFVAILELLWSFAFDSALIQNQEADRQAYDTAWTLNAALGLIVATGLLLLAMPASVFYDEPRLVPLIGCLAIGSFFQGFENIGVVAFRKELRFSSEFYYQIARKLSVFLGTIPLAFVLRTYWALAIGIIVGRIVNVAISYAVHSYRPKLCLKQVHILVNFSKWLFANNILYVLTIRSQDFVIGKFVGAAGLGLYNISYEIANMPASNLVYPINRAVFPGFSKMAADRVALRDAYVQVVAMVALVAIPAGLGIASIAELMIPVVFGQKWIDAIPVVEVLAIYGMLAALSSVFGPVFMALGRPKVLTVFTCLNLVLFIPGVVIGAINWGVVGAAWACLTVVSIMMPLSHLLASRFLEIDIRRIIGVLWRPFCAASIMYLGVLVYLRSFAMQGDTLTEIFTVLIAIAVGACTYFAVLAGLWLVAGKPDGAERKALNALKALRSSFYASGFRKDVTV